MKIESLDGLRGFSLLLVLIFHSFTPYTQGGFIGVEIFFVLSGFLITNLLLLEHEQYNKIRFKNFYMRRFLRLAPALLIMVTTFYVYSEFFTEGENKGEPIKVVLAALFYVANFVRAYDWFPMGYLGITWSLSIEEQFYFIWPIFLLFLLTTIRNKMHVLYFVFFIVVLMWVNRSILVLSNTPVERLYFGTDTHSDGLLVGCIAAIFMTTHRNYFVQIIDIFGKMKIFIPLMAISFFVLSTLFIGMYMRSIYIWYLPILEVVSAIFICYLYCEGSNNKILLFSNKYLVWLGSISYGVYLWHWFIYRVLHTYDIKGMSVVFIGGAISIAIASLSYYFVEKPVLKLKSRYR